MNLLTDIIIYYIKLFIMNTYVYYCLKKISNIKEYNIKFIAILIIVNLILIFICAYIEFFINSFLSSIIVFFLYTMILSILGKKKIGYSLIVSIIAYAICAICFGIAVIVEYIPYKLLNINNYYLNLAIILLIQFGLLQSFLKIKRFKNGFDFLDEKLNNDFTDIIMINISITVILTYCLLGTIVDEIRKNLVFAFVILGFTTIAIIQKTLTMYYKQKLLKGTLQEYKKEIKEKDEELKKLKDEKFNISKITHKFYNRQKALELLVKENIDIKSNTTKENASKNVLEIIKSLTEEYSEELNQIKNLTKLETTEIPEIDSMFKYMQSECNKNKIEFKLKIIGNIHPLINNIITKNKLETLIGDHLRDAINAVNSAKTEHKEILAILGIKDKKYELTIYDTGIEFEIKTLLKLGSEATTTYANKGGSGIGFLTTFETMKQTKASLIINEQPPEKERYYTKAVTIRFDSQNQYKICSYRADEIKKQCDNKRVIIENI